MKHLITIHSIDVMKQKTQQKPAAEISKWCTYKTKKTYWKYTTNHFKAYFSKKKQEKKNRVEIERLEIIEILHHQASAKNLDKTFC